MLHRILFDLGVAAVFLIMMSVLVTAHELGHYVAARMFKMGVEEFAIGFGKNPLVTYWKRRYSVSLTPAEAEEYRAGGLRPRSEEKGAIGLAAALESPESVSSDGEVVETAAGPVLYETTNFTVRPLPLGGFVRIKGMLPEEDGSEVKVPAGFYSKPPVQRLVVLFAGPLFSVLAGLILLVPYNMIVGIPRLSHKPIIDGIAVGKAADKAGVKQGDLVVAIDGKPITDYFQVIEAVRDHADIPLAFQLKRGDQLLTLKITPEKDKTPTPVFTPDLELSDQRKIQGKIGAVPAEHFVPLGFFAASQEALLVPVETVGGLLKTIAEPSQFKEQVGGPETMVRLTADATSSGISQVINLAAILSISIGVFNLLPFPPLDGGQMVMSFAELLRGGRRLSVKAQGFVVAMGMAVVGMLVISVVYIDFQRWRTVPDEGDKAPAAVTKPVQK